MKRLLDANVFIEAKNRYYGFDICPGFWGWMDTVFQGGVGTVDKVWAELLGKGDELSDWAKGRKSSAAILAVDDKATQSVFQDIANHVATGQYKPAAIAQFLSGADPWLIAKAKTTGATVVTHEVLAKQAKKKVPIPNICEEFDVSYEDTFNTLRTFNAEFN